jgi:hypothetical protein
MLYIIIKLHKRKIKFEWHCCVANTTFFYLHCCLLDEKKTITEIVFFCCRLSLFLFEFFRFEIVLKIWFENLPPIRVEMASSLFDYYCHSKTFNLTWGFKVHKFELITFLCLAFHTFIISSFVVFIYSCISLLRIHFFE